MNTLYQYLCRYAGTWRDVVRGRGVHRQGQPAKRLYSMLTHAEMQWAEDYIRTAYRGAGSIVDLGCWMGSSTIALAKGLLANPLPIQQDGTIHVYDRFIWEPWMLPHIVGTPLEAQYSPGDSFVDAFQQQIRPWHSLIQVHSGDLLEQQWSGQPIEFLFIDVMKDWQLTNQVLHEFFPALIAGRSVIQHQDFVHYYTPWIALLTYRLKEYFEPIDFVPHSFSVIFQLCKPLPREVLSTTYAFSSFTDEEFEAAFAYACSLVDAKAAKEIQLARVMAFVHMGQLHTARAELQKLQGTLSPDESPRLTLIEQELALRQT